MLWSVSDGLIWLGGVASGVAVIWAAWKAIALIQFPSNVLLGKWYGYSYFYDSDYMRFYKEIIIIKRSAIRPWTIFHETRPCGGDEPAGYVGPIWYHAPYVYALGFEKSSKDRTFEIGRLVMGSDHKYRTIVSLHLGNSYEETVHSASACLWVREQLDPTANEKLPPNELEAQEFRERVRRFVKIDREYLQIQLTPPRNSKT